MLKKIIASFVLVFVLLGTVFTAAAAGENYIKVDIPGGTQEHRLSREIYEAVDQLQASDFGLDERFKGITDIFYSDVHGILLLCGSENLLFKISEDYKKAEIVEIKDKEGNVFDFTDAEGVYSDEDGNIYISDTKKERVIIADKNGMVTQEPIKRPKSDLIPKDFQFQPTKIVKDSHGYTYILSMGCYYGALLYNPQNEFMGFYGPNTVKSSALDTLAYLWDRLTSSDTKKDYEQKTLPYSFTDFAFDEQGFMVTCTSATNAATFVVQNETGQIKKISHNGANILYKRTLQGEIQSSSDVNFTEPSVAWGMGGQSIDSIATRGDYIFALETGHGKISVYDSECNLMSAFGGGVGAGKQLGLFHKPVAITINGNGDLLVADNGNYSFTIFKTTPYGDSIFKAQSLYLKGNYDDAAEEWKNILAENRNCQLAYRGLAMVAYNLGDYDQALEYAEIACDYAVYDLAWSKIVSQFVADYFAIIIAIILVIVIAIYILIRKLKKKGKKLINNEKLKLLFNVPFHPFNSFDELKYKKKGSTKIAIVLTVLFYIASVLNVTSTGFLYRNTLLRNYNSLFTVFATAGLLLLWSVCNWLVCSMFEGKGTFKDVYTSTSYCVMPWIAFLFIKVIMTNFLPLSTAGLITGIESVILIYTIFLLSIALIKIHDFDFFKVLLTTIVVVFFMILVIFVILMCGILAEQFISFIVELYEEVVYR